MRAFYVARKWYNENYSFNWGAVWWLAIDTSMEWQFLYATRTIFWPSKSIKQLWYSHEQRDGALILHLPKFLRQRWSWICIIVLVETHAVYNTTIHSFHFRHCNCVYGEVIAVFSHGHTHAQATTSCTNTPVLPLELPLIMFVYIMEYSHRKH